MKTRPLWMFYAGFVCFAWVFKMVLNVVSPYLIGQIKGGGMFIRYNSPFIVGTAVALLLIFPGCIFHPEGLSPVFHGWRQRRSAFMCCIVML